MVLDRLLTLALVGEAGADLAMKLGHMLEVLTPAVELERPFPHADRSIHAAEPQRNIALLLEQPGDRVGILACLLERGLVVGVGVRV